VQITLPNILKEGYLNLRERKKPFSEKKEQLPDKARLTVAFFVKYPVFWDPFILFHKLIRSILVRIRIGVSVPLTNGSGSNDLQDANKNI
jgi:hypothetical protein